VTHIQGAL